MQYKGCGLGLKNCNESKPCPMHFQFKAIRDDLKQMLEVTTVQGLANDDVRGSINSRLIKEMLLAALNGIILAIFLFLFVWLYKGEIDKALAISVSLVVVIIVAGIIGTFVPLFLNKRGVDPAIATGPFITTSNDILGILLYFWIAELIIAFFN